MVYCIELSHFMKTFFVNTVLFIYSHLLKLRKLVTDSTNRANQKKLLNQRKDAIRIAKNKPRFEHNKELFNSQKVLNIYKLNILNTAIFRHTFYNETAPA